MNLLIKNCFVILLLIISCNKENNTLLKEINTYHVDISKKELKDISRLKKYQHLIENNQAIPDSIKAHNNYLIGSYFYKKSIKDSASVYLHKATTLIDSSNFTKKNALYFLTLWEYYKAQEKYGDCFSTAKRFKQFINLDTDFKNTALYYYFQEYYYINIKDYKNALEFNKKRIHTLKKIGDVKKTSRALISQAKLKNPQEAIEVLEDLIHKSEEFPNDFNRETFGEYANKLFYQKRFTECLNFNKKGLEYTKKISDNAELKKSYIINYYINISEVYMMLEQYETSQKYLDSIQTIGYQNSEIRLQKEALKYQIRLNNATKQYDKTITDFENIFNFLDKGYQEKYNKELGDLKVSIENERQLLYENELIELKNIKLKSQTYFILFSFIIVILIGVIFYNRNKYKHKKEKLYINQQLFRSQMNPHFTFNALSIIQNYIKKDPSTASQYLMKFSRLLRLTLENSLSNFVSLRKELESLQKYIELQSLRFPDKFEYDINVEYILNSDVIYIPPMLIQPFIENSINHGFSDIQHKGLITISLTKYNSTYLQCSIIDNGKGFQKKKRKDSDSTSIKLINNFIKRTTNTEIKIIDLCTLKNEGTGVNVQFLIPYKLENNGQSTSYR